MAAPHRHRGPGAGRPGLRRVILHRRAAPPRGGAPDEPAAEGVQRGHPEAQLPSDRALADPLRSEVRPAGPPRSAGLPRAAPGRERPVEGAPPRPARRQLRPGAARRVREPPAATRRGQGSDAGQGTRLAGSVRGDLPPEDQRVPRDGRPRDLRRRGALRPARGQPDQPHRARTSATSGPRIGRIPRTFISTPSSSRTAT